jgi:predicted component of type VI protein secretion system
MKARLVVEQGARRRAVQIDGPEAVLGRAHGNAVRIPSSEVSRRHCRLIIEEGLLRVEDLGSVNGTFLNGRRIQQVEYVRPGDHLEVGPVTFVVEYEMTPDALERLQRVEAAGVLELLADGEAAVGEELPMLEAIEEDALAALAAIETDDAPVESGRLDELAPLALAPSTEPEPEMLPPADDGPLPADFDFDATPWQMPESGDLRDILSQMEDDDAPTQFPAPKKPK